MENQNNQIVCIVFNGHPLPRAALFLDAIFRLHCFSEIDDDIAVWFWRFTICGGCDHDAPSPVVTRYACITLEVLAAHPEDCLAELTSFYGEPAAEDVYNEWIETLSIMIELARRRELCHWTGLTEQELKEQQI